MINADSIPPPCKHLNNEIIKWIKWLRETNALIMSTRRSYTTEIRVVSSNRDAKVIMLTAFTCNAVRAYGFIWKYITTMHLRPPGDLLSPMVGALIREYPDVFVF